MMLNDYDYLTLCIYAIRVGKKNSEWRLAYGVVTPVQNKMPTPIESGSNDLGSCEYGKISMRKVFYSCERDIILGVFNDLMNGVSLIDSFAKWGIDTSMLHFDVKFTQNAVDENWGEEQILSRQLSYTRRVSMIDPEQLFEKDGKKPSDVEKAILRLEERLNEETGLPFGEKFDHVGNLDIVIAPDRDAAGRPLIEYQWEKENPCVQHVIIKQGLLKTGDELTVNIVCKEDGRTIRDTLDSFCVEKEENIKKDYEIGACPDSLEVKIWRLRNGISQVVSDSEHHFLKRIRLSVGVMEGKMKVETDWMKEIRCNLPDKKAGELEKAATISRGEKEHSIIGEPIKKRRTRKIPVKSNDAFFPKGWDPETEEQGMLSFLAWFKNKANNAKYIFLQDPYFEDVAMYCMASADVNCEYTVLTQTQLKTNSDGTPRKAEEGEVTRKEKIVGGIKANPRLFNPMKLVVMDIPISHNALHDRYLIFDYGEGKIEAYALSNSLQGATRNMPLLITQIGDTAFWRLKGYISDTINRGDIEVVYNYASPDDSEQDDEKQVKVADEGFFRWLKQCKEVMKGGDVAAIVADIKSWKTDEKLATLGYFLADIPDSEAYKIFEHIAAEMKNDSWWIGVLKEFVLKKHYSNYPVGYIRTPYKGHSYSEPVYLLGMDYQQIVTAFNTHIADNLGCDRFLYGVYGQYFAAKLLLKLSIPDYIDILKQLKPTLNGIDTDKSVTPCYKVTAMLIGELIDADFWEKQDKVMTTLMSDSEEWCRGIGALLYLNRSKKEEFRCQEYGMLVTNDDEMITLCHAAWGMKPAAAHIEVFYNWTVDAFCRKGDAEYFKKRLKEEILGESHFLEDKVDYMKNVAVPLIAIGLIGKDELSEDMIGGLFEKSISGDHTYMMRDALPDCLHVLDGDISLLYDLAKARVEKLQKDLMKLALKNEDNVYYAAKECIELRVMMKRLVEKYKKTKNATVGQVGQLLDELDYILDENGLERTKKMFEDLK